MTYEQITNLLDRGFSPDQITLLTTSGNPTHPDEPAPAGDAVSHPLAESPAGDTDTGTTSPVEVPAAADQAAAVAEKTTDNSAAVLDAIADLKKTVQANNIKTMHMDTISGENELEAALSEIIRPSLKKGE